MLFTAAIFMCMIDKPHTFDSCHVINSPYKYETAEECWASLSLWTRYQINAYKDYELIGARCISWIEPKFKV